MSAYLELKIINLLRGISAKLDVLVTTSTAISNQESAIMTTITDLQTKAAATLAQVQADTSVANGVKTVVDNMNANLAALQAQNAALQAAGTADPAALQSLSDTIDAITSTDMANSAIVAAAVTAGTPAPPPAPAPTPTP